MIDIVKERERVAEMCAWCDIEPDIEPDYDREQDHLVDCS